MRPLQTNAGFIKDILDRDDWSSLFVDLPNSDGFVAKLSDFSARHRGALSGENGRHAYFHPLRRNALSSDRLVELAQAACGGALQDCKRCRGRRPARTVGVGDGGVDWRQ